MTRRIILLLFLLGIFGVILSSTVIAQDVYSLPLLAVQELENGSYTGSIADLYLELQPGSGRVFLDTSPLTKIDTQASTRYAKGIACDYFDLNCDQYDFIYTIRARSNIIGGPSAGAAIAALTTIAVLDLPYDEKISITGTINTGGIVGPVGGIKEKIKAGAKNNLHKVLVPLGSYELLKKESNLTFDNDSNLNKSILINVGSDDTNNILINTTNDNLDLPTEEHPLSELNPFSEFPEIDYGVDVVEVATLTEAIKILTSKDLKKIVPSFEVDVGYTKIMASLDKELCDRSKFLEEEIIKITKKEVDIDFFNVSKRKNEAQAARVNGDFYSSASFCFGLNIAFQEKLFQINNFSNIELNKKYQTLLKNVKQTRDTVNSEEINTISDLQTKIIVTERLDDAEQLLSRFEENNSLTYPLAYARERLYSALSWMQFFSMEGKHLSLNTKNLARSCTQKIDESEERYNYATVYLPKEQVSYISDKITQSKLSFEQGKYELCLVRASQAKAEASSILSSLGMTEEVFDVFLDTKEQAVKEIMSEQSREGSFPILGYSYYQYAQSLREDEPHSGLLYLEYALELSDLQSYFPKEKISSDKFSLQFSFQFLSGFIVGILVSVGILFLLQHLFSSQEKKRKEKIRKQIIASHKKEQEHREESELRTKKHREELELKYQTELEEKKRLQKEEHKPWSEHKKEDFSKEKITPSKSEDDPFTDIIDVLNSIDDSDDTSTVFDPLTDKESVEKTSNDSLF